LSARTAEAARRASVGSIRGWIAFSLENGPSTKIGNEIPGGKKRQRFSPKEKPRESRDFLSTFFWPFLHSQKSRQALSVMADSRDSDVDFVRAKDAQRRLQNFIFTQQQTRTIHHAVTRLADTCMDICVRPGKKMGAQDKECIANCGNR
jgi:hypothetical protein